MYVVDLKIPFKAQISVIETGFDSLADLLALLTVVNSPFRYVYYISKLSCFIVYLFLPSLLPVTVV